MTKPTYGDYPYIEAWGKLMGSFSYYIADQVQKARATKAPRTAIYERDGVWRTYEEITEPSTIWSLNNILKTMGITK